MKKTISIFIFGSFLALVYLGAAADFVSPLRDELSFFRSCSFDVCVSEIEKNICQKKSYNPFIQTILSRRFGSEAAQNVFAKARSHSFFMECY